MQLVKQLAAGGRALAIVIGLSLCVAGCDKKDDDSDEETEEEEDDDESKSKEDDSAESKATDDPATTDSSAVAPATPTPTTQTPPSKVILDAGTPPPKDAGTTTTKDAGTTAKPGAQACLQKCANLLGQCTTSAPKDGGPFAIPNLAKCQAAGESCRKACGH